MACFESEVGGYLDVVDNMLKNKNKVSKSNTWIDITLFF
jgi:hypothetical protein